MGFFYILFLQKLKPRVIFEVRFTYALMSGLKKKKGDEILGILIKTLKDTFTFYSLCFFVFSNVGNMGLMLNCEFISQMCKILFFSVLLLLKKSYELRQRLYEAEVSKILEMTYRPQKIQRGLLFSVGVVLKRRFLVWLFLPYKYITMK